VEEAWCMCVCGCVCVYGCVCVCVCVLVCVKGVVVVVGVGGWWRRMAGSFRAPSDTRVRSPH
jgi:hypothetical protein